MQLTSVKTIKRNASKQKKTGCTTKANKQHIKICFNVHLHMVEIKACFRFLCWLSASLAFGELSIRFNVLWEFTSRQHNTTEFQMYNDVNLGQGQL
jgi:hypothetical protein